MNWAIMNKALILALLLCTSSWAEMISSDLLAHKNNNGYTWTLTSRLGDVIALAESSFGKRDTSWTILGVEFSSDGPPQLWFPGSYDNRHDIIIQLTKSSATNSIQSFFQLAHEVIHILSPSGGNDNVTVFEEGLSSHFSVRYVESRIPVRLKPNECFKNSKYLLAYHMIQDIYTKYPDADERIRSLRLKNNNSFSSNLSKELIKEVFPKIDETNARELAAIFCTWEPVKGIQPSPSP